MQVMTHKCNIYTP